MNKYIEKLDKGYELIYVDYSDDLNSREFDLLLNECIHQNSIHPLDDIIEKYYRDYDYDSIDYIIRDTFSDEELEEIENNFDLRLEIEDAIRERDTSNPVEDLLRNTNNHNFVYKTKTELHQGETKSNIQKIKKAIQRYNIKGLTDEDIKELEENAFYGGQLCFLFKTHVTDLLTEKNYKKMTIKGGYIAIIDSYNGSGYDLRVESVTIPFRREKIAIERYYVDDVSYMVLDNSNISFLEETKKRKIQNNYKYYPNSVGNILADDISMLHVRAWNETECNGIKNEPGHLWRFDIETWQKKRELSKSIIEKSKQGGWIAAIYKTHVFENNLVGFALFSVDGELVQSQLLYECFADYFYGFIDNIKKK